MQVALSSPASLHAVHLALALHQRGLLAHFYGGSSLRELTDRLPEQRVSLQGWLGIAQRAARQLPAPLGRRLDPCGLPLHLFERFVTARLQPEADHFLGAAGASLLCLRRAAEQGLRTILDAPHGHVRSQLALRSVEYERWGLPASRTSSRRIERVLAEYETAQRIAVSNRALAETFLQEGMDRSRLLFLPRGVDLEHFRPSSSAREKDEERRILFAGDVSVQNGCHYLLRAFHELRLPNATLWLVGPVHDDMGPFLRRWAGKRVALHGRVPYADLPTYYRDADLYCCPGLSARPTTGVAEALASGLPVIASDESGADEELEDGVTGRFVAGRDIEAWQVEILRLCGDREEALALGSEGRRQAERDLSWSVCAERFLTELAVDSAAPRPNSRLKSA